MKTDSESIDAASSDAATASIRLERHGNGVVAVPDRPLPPLTAGRVRAEIESLRERGG